VTLKVPKLRTLPFETAIIERYRRRESSVEEALVEMYLAGVSVEDITEALWGTRVSPSTVSELNQKIYAQIESWRNRAIEGKHPYVFLDGLWLKRSWGGEVRNVSLLVAIGVNDEGFREVLAGSRALPDRSFIKCAKNSRHYQLCCVFPGRYHTSFVWYLPVIQRSTYMRRQGW
jgi:transposase-like protein